MFFTGEYWQRQRQANEHHCVAYIEHHFNASINKTANYTVVIVANNASQTSRKWGRQYAQKISSAFHGIPIGGDRGLKVEVMVGEEITI